MTEHNIADYEKVSQSGDFSIYEYSMKSKTAPDYLLVDDADNKIPFSESEKETLSGLLSGV